MRSVVGGAGRGIGVQAACRGLITTDFAVEEMKKATS